MLIATADDVRAAYPHVPPPAVAALLDALRGCAPLLRAGRVEQGAAELRRRLAAYPGDYDDLRRLGVPAIFAAATRGAAALEAQLGELRLLERPGGPVYVVAGDPLAARLWAGQRGITARVIAVHAGHDAARLRGLEPRDTVIVRLTAAPLPPRLADALDTLLLHGATTRGAGWRPAGGADPDAGRPRLNLR